MYLLASVGTTFLFSCQRSLQYGTLADRSGEQSTTQSTTRQVKFYSGFVSGGSFVLGSTEKNKSESDSSESDSSDAYVLWYSSSVSMPVQISSVPHLLEKRAMPLAFLRSNCWLLVAEEYLLFISPGHLLTLKLEY